MDKERRRLVQELLAGPLGLRFRDPVQWFYDPMAVTAFAGHMDERAIVFDCMDQLSQFKGAPKELLRRERELLQCADVVFAGGPKIGRDKIKYNANTHSYGCGVDVKHFGKARCKSTEIPADVANLTGPVFGFFGVVDERMDYELVAAWPTRIRRARRHHRPHDQGRSRAVPQRPNLHWLGGRDYSLLPAYVKRFDVCLMPFAINEATEYINPTKALEYMATGKPIVSTPVEDVVLQFSGVVKISQTSEEFIALCSEAAANRRTRVHQARPGHGGAQFVGIHRRGDGRPHRRRHGGELSEAASGAAERRGDRPPVSLQNYPGEARTPRLQPGAGREPFPPVTQRRPLISTRLSSWLLII